jgi:hypothetical protein
MYFRHRKVYIIYYLYMKIGKTIKNLCTPAYVYIFISAFAILFALFSGFGIVAVLTKAVFVIFWTYVLNMLCKKGYKNVSWFLVLLPYFFILLGFLQTNEGFDTATAQSQKAPLPTTSQGPVIAAGSAKVASTTQGPLIAAGSAKVASTTQGPVVVTAPAPANVLDYGGKYGAQTQNQKKTIDEINKLWSLMEKDTKALEDLKSINSNVGSKDYNRFFGLGKATQKPNTKPNESGYLTTDDFTYSNTKLYKDDTLRQTPITLGVYLQDKLWESINLFGSKISQLAGRYNKNRKNGQNLLTSDIYSTSKPVWQTDTQASGLYYNK